MQIGFHHYHKRKEQKKNYSSSHKKLVATMDGMVYVIGSFSVIIFLPQLFDIWTKNDISGVSLISWVGLFVGSTFWIFYGYVHKAKPLIIMNSCTALIQFLIILGIILHT